ncbi:uncharacterized protein [Ptychodera flava]|uniref:uncharacterized protein n=1 Tax=Ptychodera flava TaxID=63121 RepID=UPI00396AAC81
MATRKNHKILVYSKLVSFNTAKEAVIANLQKQIIDEDKYLRGTVEVADYGGYQQSQSVQLCTITVVVVIDARQTRTLVTPHRRDKHVDHWDELDMLQNNVTKPKGSIILVIYGDEESKNLEEDLVADRWRLVWKFNDVFALDLVNKNRCFTIFEKFNEGQCREIRKYIQLLPLIPVYIGETTVAVFGDGIEETLFDSCLKYHPFLRPGINQQPLNPSSQNSFVASAIPFSFGKSKSKDGSITLYCHKCDVNELLDGTLRAVSVDKKLEKTSCDLCIVIGDQSHFEKFDKVIHGDDGDKKLKAAVINLIGLNPSSMFSSFLPSQKDENVIEHYKKKLEPFVEDTMIVNSIWRYDKKNRFEEIRSTYGLEESFKLYGLYRCLKTKTKEDLNKVYGNQCIALFGNGDSHEVLAFLADHEICDENECISSGMAPKHVRYALDKKLRVFDFCDTDTKKSGPADFVQRIKTGVFQLNKNKHEMIHAIVYASQHDMEHDMVLSNLETSSEGEDCRLPIFLIYVTKQANGTSSNDPHGTNQRSDGSSIGAMVSDDEGSLLRNNFSFTLASRPRTRKNLANLFDILTLSKDYQDSQKPKK